MDEIYRNTPLDEIPWNREEPPELLIHFIESENIQPCRTLDLGCGAGNYAVYLATRGCEVTGVDFTATAIKLAQQNAKKKGLQCTFIAADVIKDFPAFDKKFDFAYDWGLLHHILPKDRQTYVNNLSAVLNPGATYISVCFSEKDASFSGRDKYKTTGRGTTLYFSSENELRELFAPCFDIIELYTTELAGKFETHTFNCALMSRK